MMKYRKLDKTELEPLRDEFVNFLASNTVTAQDWENIKSEEPDKAERLIEMFSDLVFEKVLAKVRLLEIRTPHTWQFLKIMEDSVEMRGMFFENVIGFDITQIESAEDIKAFFASNPDSSIKIVNAFKNFEHSREEEVFDWIKKGALISGNSAIFESLGNIDN